MTYISAETLKPLLTDGGEIAFIDVREHGQYGEGHPFFSVNIPYSVFETVVGAMLPSRSVRCVLLDDGDGTAEKAARVLSTMGYSDVQILQGGAAAWAAAGFTLFKGVNVPSKAFGELVEGRRRFRRKSSSTSRNTRSPWWCWMAAHPMSSAGCRCLAHAPAPMRNSDTG